MRLRFPPAAILLLTAVTLAVLPLASRLAKIGPQLAGDETSMTPAALRAVAINSSDPTLEAQPMPPLLAVEDIAPEAGPDLRSSPPAVPLGDAPQRVMAAVSALAQELHDRREKLLRREQELELRAAALELLGRAVDQKAAELAARADELRSLEGQASAEESARLQRVVKVYDAMKAKAVAGIFDQMPLDQLVPVAAQLREAKLAAIVAEMSPDKSRQLMLSLSKSR